ncbi:MAG TPA: hypothetical protein VI461_03240, partial [Chitinophagaceae bacterium]|nr:hypothetical protein [Chitinophagaceae bacterium]
MSQQEKPLTEKESLELITMMINTAKNSYYDTGVSAIMWGAVIAFCSLEKLAELHFGYRLPFDIYLLTIVAIIPQIIFSIREKKERKVKLYDDAYMDYIWLGFGICIFLMILIVNNVFDVWEPMAEEYRKLGGQSVKYRFHEFVSPLFLLLY